eukprot:11003810-Lingulodinium_polyedra.AAC.1
MNNMHNTRVFELNTHTRNARRRAMPPAPPKSNVGSGNAKRGAYKHERLFRTPNPPGRGAGRVPTLASGAK